MVGNGYGSGRISTRSSVVVIVIIDSVLASVAPGGGLVVSMSPASSVGMGSPGMTETNH